MLSADDVRTWLKDRARVMGSQRELAKKIGISQAYLCHLLTGKREPAGKVLDFLGVQRVVGYKCTNGIKARAAKRAAK